MPRPKLDRTTAVSLTVALALFMENLDASVITTALPQIARSFGSDPVQLSSAVTSYLLSLAIFIPATGWLAERWGARRVFLSAVMVFALGSVFCAMSGDPAQLTASRIVQGLGGAMMVPVGRIILLRSVSKAGLVRAVSFLTVPALLGPMLGPPVGGLITTYASWPWIFLLNVPVALLLLIVVLRVIDRDVRTECPPFDALGFALSACALGGLVLSFETAARSGLSVALGLVVGVSVLAAGLYVVHARRHPEPILQPGPLHVPTFRLTLIGGGLFRIGAGALPFLVPMLLQLGFGLTAFASGMLSLAGAAGSLIMRVAAGSVLRTCGFRTALIGNGLLCAVLAAGHAALQPATPIWVIAALLFSAGFFRGLQYNALAALTYADVPENKISAATALSNTGQQLCQSVGIAFGALLLQLALWSRDGATPGTSDFLPSFIVVSIAMSISGLLFLRLRRDAGAALTDRAERN
jgi:EmrB/QacA subfamily drug resistance transporter